MQVSANICSHVIHLCPVIIRIAELRNDGINRTEKYLLFLLNLISSSGFFLKLYTLSSKAHVVYYLLHMFLHNFIWFALQKCTFYSEGKFIHHTLHKNICINYYCWLYAGMGMHLIMSIRWFLGSNSHHQA